MRAQEVLKIALSGTQDVLNWYLSDLADADLQVRPVPGANNIAWQLGHLINSEVFLMSELPGATYPELPANLKGQYDAKKSKEPPAGYLPKTTYLEWFNSVRRASIANVERLTDADLDRPSKGPLAKFAPTLASLIMLVSNHTLMHAGQFSVTRRALNKPVLF